MRNSQAQRQGNKKDHDASKDVTTDGWGGTGCRNTGVHKWIAGGGRGTIQRLCKGRIAWSNQRMVGTERQICSDGDFVDYFSLLRKGNQLEPL
jgi:hypothetical protein